MTDDIGNHFGIHAFLVHPNIEPDPRGPRIPVGKIDSVIFKKIDPSNQILRIFSRTDEFSLGIKFFEGIPLIIRIAAGTVRYDDDVAPARPVPDDLGLTKFFLGPFQTVDPSPARTVD